MLGLLGVMPGGLKMLLLGAVVALAGALAWYIYDLKSDRDEALTLAATQKVALSAQEDTIASLHKAVDEWIAHAGQLSADVAAMASAQREATVQTRKLNDVLSRHNLHALALAKPGLIESRINAGSVDALCMFEHATGGHSDKACGSGEAD